jgi:hypothetical protein
MIALRFPETDLSQDANRPFGRSEGTRPSGQKGNLLEGGSSPVVVPLDEFDRISQPLGASQAPGANRGV